MNSPDDPRMWIAKAENDLLCIHNNLAHDSVPWDAVCFHAQQAAEKMLKAFLISRGRVAPRIHDLPALLTECLEAGASFDQLESDCRTLNPYSVMFRYPGSPEPTQHDARLAIDAAERISRTVRAAIL